MRNQACPRTAFSLFFGYAEPRISNIGWLKTSSSIKFIQMSEQQLELNINEEKQKRRKYFISNQLWTCNLLYEIKRIHRPTLDLGLESLRKPYFNYLYIFQMLTQFSQQSLSIKYYIIMSKQIQTIGYRNAIYAGETNALNATLNGVGIILDDAFFTCLSTWITQKKAFNILDGTNDYPKATGPTVVLTPERQIFYAQSYPQNHKLNNFWCFINRQVKIFGFGEKETVVIQDQLSNTIGIVKLNSSNKTIQIEEELQIRSLREKGGKWDKIEQVLGCQVLQMNRSFQSFIMSNFKGKTTNQDYKIYEKHNDDGITFGLYNNQNQGLSFTVQASNGINQVKQVGYYCSFYPKPQMIFGRTYINCLDSSYIVEQGIRQTDEVYRFKNKVSRPPQSYMTSRKFFNQKDEFQNSYVRLKGIQAAYHKINWISKKYEERNQKQHGQKTIQGQRRSSQTMTYTLQEAKARIQSEVRKKKQPKKLTVNPPPHLFHQSPKLSPKNIDSPADTNYTGRYKYLKLSEQPEQEYRQSNQINQFSIYSQRAPQLLQSQRFQNIGRQQIFLKEIAIDHQLKALQDREEYLHYLKTRQRQIQKERRAYATSPNHKKERAINYKPTLFDISNQVEVKYKPTTLYTHLLPMRKGVPFNYTQQKSKKNIVSNRTYFGQEKTKNEVENEGKQEAENRLQKRQVRQISRTPMGRKGGAGKKIFSYVD